MGCSQSWLTRDPNGQFSTLAPPVVPGQKPIRTNLDLKSPGEALQFENSFFSIKTQVKKKKN
jgi:hypothetical protein